jgi:predicted DNA-binding mobile mystery protein A
MLLSSHGYSKNAMLRSLPLQQLDKTLSLWRSLPRSRPSGGWLRAVRQTLGMTTRQLAKAVGVTQAAVVGAERTEARGDITLTTLQRYAAALGCELTYALVPKRPLQEVVEERAERIARDEVSRVKHSMALEDQSTGREHLEREIAELRRKLMEGKRSRLWQ